MPVLIKPMLDRLSWIVLKTRPAALMHLRDALSTRKEWKPRYRLGPKIDSDQSCQTLKHLVGTFRQDC